MSVERVKLNDKDNAEVRSDSWLRKVFEEKDCDFSHYFKREVCAYLHAWDLCNLRRANLDTSGLVFAAKLTDEYWSGVLLKCTQLLEFCQKYGCHVWDLEIEAEKLFTGAKELHHHECSLLKLIHANRDDLMSLRIRLPKPYQQGAGSVSGEWNLFKAIDHCRRLQDLRFENFCDAHEISVHISIQLETLVLKNCDPIDITWIDFSKMQTFMIYRDDGPEVYFDLQCIENLRTAQDLVELKISHQAGIEDFSPILALKNLQQLSLSDISFKTITSFRSLSQLRELVIRSSKERVFEDEEHYFREHQALTLPTGIELLEISQYKLEDFSFLRRLNNLNTLRINLGRVTNIDLKFCNPAITHLRLISWDHTPDWQAIKARFTDLHTIEIDSENEIEYDEILPILSSMPHLTTIIDAGVETYLKRSEQSCAWRYLNYQDAIGTREFLY